MTMTRILEKHDSIKVAFDKYVDTLQKTNERRELWTNETKAKIIESLTLVKDSFKCDWLVQRLERTRNCQTINICFNTKNSGIVDVKIDESTGKEKGVKSYTKHGGYLAYCQSYNGKINVIIGFPYIDEWVFQMDAKVIDTIEPERVTEELISSHVIKFLDIMTEWEGKDRNPIGFK
jgi:hypothetical protein